MSRIEIDAAAPNDMNFLVEMQALSLKSLPHVASKSQLEIEAMARIDLATWEAGRDFAFIARINGQRVGAVWLRAHGERTARLYNLGIAVAPAFQRRGVGSRLIEYALDYCARNNGISVNLKVHPGNLPAMRLYRRFEFEEVSLEMRKKL